MHDQEYQFLPFADIAGGMVVVTRKTKIGKIGIDPGHRRQISGGGVSEKTSLCGVVNPVKAIPQTQSILGID